VRQDLTRIQDAVEDGSFFDNEVLKRICDAGRESGRLHLIGLVSWGGVHSSMEHLHAAIQLAAREGVPDIVLHALTDGRDTAPDSGAGYVAEAEGWLREAGGRVATVGGRYYGMDRDKRWDRIKLAWDAIVHGESDCPHADSGEAAVRAAYEREETDEFIKPTVVGDEGRIRDGDAVLFFNFRSDRARELTRALADPSFKEFDRSRLLELSAYVCMTRYDETFTYPIAFEPQDLSEIFPEIVARAGLRQLRTAETEKYAHVTFFFNGGREMVFQNEDRILVPSPRDVKTYDQKPEMSAREVADKLCQSLLSGKYGFVLANFANPDMVGHTGVLEAAVKAVKVVDECIGRVWHACQKAGIAMLVTADHGNCETMVDPVTGEPHTAHTLNPVPFILADPDFRGAKLRQKGILADVAPTALRVMGLPQPKEMKGLGLVMR